MMTNLATGKALSHFTGYCYFILVLFPFSKLKLMANLATGQAWSHLTGYCYFMIGPVPLSEMKIFLMVPLGVILQAIIISF